MLAAIVAFTVAHKSVTTEKRWKEEKTHDLILLLLWVSSKCYPKSPPLSAPSNDVAKERSTSQYPQSDQSKTKAKRKERTF